MADTVPPSGRVLAWIALGLALVVMVWVGLRALGDPALEPLERARRFAGPLAAVLIASSLLARDARIRTLLAGVGMLVAIVVIALAFTR